MKGIFGGVFSGFGLALKSLMTSAFTLAIGGTSPNRAIDGLADQLALRNLNRSNGMKLASPIFG